MPSLMSKHSRAMYIGLGLSTLFLSVTLVGCGSGDESEARIEPPKPEVNTPKPRDFGLKVPVEMRDVVIKVYDNFDNSLVLEQPITTTTNQNFTLPYVLNTSHLYRIELSSTPRTLIYDFLSGQYQPFTGTIHALVMVNTSNLTQNIFINPSSEAIYQRALIRSGYLINDKSQDSRKISKLHLELAMTDVNNALLKPFAVDVPNLETSFQLSALTDQDVRLRPAVYSNTYLSLGYLQQWANSYPIDSYAQFSKNLALDLSDGYLDAKIIHGDPRTLTSLMPAAPNNIDPAKNTLINIASNQTNIRETFATSLKNSVLQLASYYKQPTLNPNGYDLLQMQSYAAGIPAIDSNTVFRINGAGDYRRAVGFADTTATCNGSIYPCKQGITGVNIINPNLPSIAYLVGHYADAASGCQLNIRANGVLELTKGTQVFRSTLDADSTDNLLQVDKATHLYLLNSSTTEPDNAALEYTFVQVNIKANQVLGASAGVDTRKAPDQLKSTQLQCSFS